MLHLIVTDDFIRGANVVTSVPNVVTSAPNVVTSTPNVVTSSANVETSAIYAFKKIE